MEQVSGKKKSKYWFYAVEPIPGALPPAPTGPTGADSASNVEPGLNGHKNDVSQDDRNANHENGITHDRNSLSPAPSLDSV
jgi:hypothetical protein